MPLPPIPVIAVLQRAFEDAGIPIRSVGVGNPETDRAQWRVQYHASATPAQRTQGDALLQTLDPQDPTTIANIKQDMASALTSRDELFALGQALWEAIPAPTTTLAATRARFMQLLRNRL